MAPGKGGYRQINKALNICAFDDYLEGQQTRLPKLLDVEQISPLVVRILGQNPGKFTLQGTNTYLIGSGKERLLIDTGQGIPDWIDLTSSTLEDAGVYISHVLLTHWHGDHTGGVPDLLRMYPALSKSIYKHTPSKSQQPIVDGQIFSVDGATLHAVHSPGHSLDHMCFILEEENAMFTGDNILGHGTAAVEHLGILMNTWRSMQERGCVKGYPAHGIVINDLPAKISGELAQKERRERQIIKALQAIKKNELTAGGRGKGSVTLQDLVTSIYGSDVDAEVKKLALEPFIEEVLRKLAEDGHVAFEMRAGVKKWFSIETI
ncbi:putative metallo-beta-lactamase domain protein [Xylariaceae sp. FL0255]|nr:putative metallo-beta-lactamase domain protein [Xylariaceae sp. FL0255]